MWEVHSTPGFDLNITRIVCQLLGNVYVLLRKLWEHCFFFNLIISPLNDQKIIKNELLRKHAQCLLKPYINQNKQ